MNTIRANVEFIKVATTTIDGSKVTQFNLCLQNYASQSEISVTNIIFEIFLI